MKKKLTIVSGNQILQLLRSNPGLSSIHALAPLQAMAQQAKKTDIKKCNCKSNGTSSISHLTAIRLQTESILSTLTPADYIAMKTILNMDEICYYRKDSNNKLNSVCL